MPISYDAEIKNASDQNVLTQNQSLAEINYLRQMLCCVLLLQIIEQQNPTHKKAGAIALLLRWLAVVYKINLEGIQSLHKEGRLSFLPGPECSLLPEKRLC